MKTLFSIHGPIDFYGDDGGFGVTQSVFWSVDTYMQHCKDNNLEVDDKLFY